MNELAAYTRALLRFTSLFIAICLLGWILWPEARSVMMGIIAGTAVSAFNSWHQATRVAKFTEAALEDGRRKSLGFATRAGISVIVVAIAAKSDEIHLLATLGSLLLSQLIMIVISFIYFQNKK